MKTKNNFEFLIFNFKLWKSFQLLIENFINLKFKTGSVLLILALIFGLNTGMAFSQTLTSGADFLRIDSGARSGGMGDAFTAVADDVNALTFNPAGLALLDKPQAGYLRMLYLSDIAYNFGGVGVPLSAGEDTWGFGAGIINLGMPSFDSTLGIAPPVSAGDNALLASVAFRIKDMVAFGVTGKYILRNIAGYNAQAFGGDAGILITPMEHLRIGLAILNVGQQVQFISAADPLPTIGRLGLAYQVLDIPHHSLLLSVDNGYDLNAQMYSGAGGVEYWYDKTLALRAGFTGDAYQQHMTAGVGVNVDIIEFDYAYAPMGTLGDTHRFSLTARLGPEELLGLAGPSNFAARPLDGALALSWKPAASADVVGYNLYVRKPGSDKLALVNRRPLNDTSVKLNHLLNGQTYAFALTSVSGAGRESGMVQLSAVPGGAAPASSLMAPTGFKAALSGDGFTLLWDASASPNVAGYNLYLADDQGKPSKKLTAQPTTDTKLILKAVNPSKTYSFLLAAVDRSGTESPLTPVLRVNQTDLKNVVVAQFLPPSHLALQSVDGKVHMTWDAAKGAVKYNLYLSHDGTDFKLLTPTGITKTEATLGPLKAGVAYYFGVSAVSADGKESQKTVQALPAQ